MLAGRAEVTSSPEDARDVVAGPASAVQAQHGAMRSAGSSSWSLRESQDKELHRLLYLRQALVGQEHVVLDPPALRHRPPAVDVPADQVPAALVAWQQWWLDALALVVLQEGDDLASEGSVPRWVRGRIPLDGAPPLWRERSHALRTAAGSMPPDGRSSLVDPVLRAVADLVEEDAHRWTTQQRREMVADLARGDLDAVRRGSVPCPVVREVAEDVAFDRGVDPGRVRATVLLLDVEDDAGAWWREVAPGVALCSFDAALHPVTARVVLRRAFAARL